MRRWSKYLLVLLLAAAFAGVAYEFGHSLALGLTAAIHAFTGSTGPRLSPMIANENLEAELPGERNTSGELVGDPAWLAL